MKRVLGAVAVAMALLFTGACSTSDNNDRRSSDVIEREDGGSNGEGSQEATEQAFLQRVAENMTSNLNDVRQQDVIDLGYAYCEDLDNGADVGELIDDVVVSSQGAINGEDAGLILGAAVRFFCDEHEQKVLDFAESQGVDTGDVLTG